MTILHQAIHRIADDRGGPIPLVGQLGIGIRRRDMGLIGAPLPTKRDRGIARIVVRFRPRIQGSNPAFVLRWFQEHFQGDEALV